MYEKAKMGMVAIEPVPVLYEEQGLLPGNAPLEFLYLPANSRYSLLSQYDP